MTNQSKPSPPPVATITRGPFLFLRGGFELGNSSVPYFSITMRVDDATNYFKLPSELPMSADRPIDLTELFQRDLDQQRVDRELVGYLRGQEHVRFFNSITVALLPLDRSNNRLEVAATYSSATTLTPNFDGYESLNVGQITLLQRPDDISHGYISWDAELTFPVVLDGQHRLAALKSAVADQSFPHKLELESTKISILFLVLDERVGFSSPANDSVLGTCRAIFTDLNKYARGVSKARQYLLDDRDLTAVALRSILAPNVVANAEGDVTDRARQDSRLPLALIDWRSDNAKFDGSSPYVSSVLALHGVVDAVLERPMPHADDYEELATYIDRVTARLLSDDDVSSFKERALVRLGEAETREMPFEMQSTEIATLANGFRNKFGARIVRPLVELTPYAKLIEALTAGGFLGTEFEPWFSLDALGRDRLLKRLDMVDPSSQIANITETAKNGDLSFQVVFQRALLLSLNSILSFPEDVLRWWELKDTHSESAVIDEWIRRTNVRLTPSLAQGASTKSAFVGAGIRPEGTIDFRKTRVTSISGMMTYVVLAPESWWKKKAVDPSIVEEWLSEQWSSIQRGPASGMQSLLSRHGAAWKRGLADVVAARGGMLSDQALVEEGAEAIRRLKR